jgi:hypothetical protein
MHKLGNLTQDTIFGARYAAESASEKLLLAGYHSEMRDYYLNGSLGVAEKLHDLANILGFRLVPIDQPVEFVPGADFQGEVPALKSAVLS